MAIRLATLRESRPLGIAVQNRYNSIDEARADQIQIVFLSHSHKDSDLALGVQGFLERQGWKVYIDWQDAAMPEQTNRQTAENIRQRIQACHKFLFLATENSLTSRWCPWEIGYADNVKEQNEILILLTQDENDERIIHGNEYLDLYCRIDFNALNRQCRVLDEGQSYGGIELTALNNL